MHTHLTGGIADIIGSINYKKIEEYSYHGKSCSLSPVSKLDSLPEEVVELCDVVSGAGTIASQLNYVLTSSLRLRSLSELSSVRMMLT